MGPNYKRPAVKAPVGFREATNAAATNSFADLPWWGVFKDLLLPEEDNLDGSFVQFSRRSGEAEVLPDWHLRPVPKARSLAALTSCPGARGRAYSLLARSAQRQAVA